MNIQRPDYLNWLREKMGNKRVKVITGLRRSGKSYLIDQIFRTFLLSQGILNDHILYFSLDRMENRLLRNPLELDRTIRSLIKDDGPYIVIIDEIQKVYPIVDPVFSQGKLQLARMDDPGKIWFPDILLGLKEIPGVDVYITGSNSRFLSSDIMTEMRDRADEIQVRPFTLQELIHHNPGKNPENVIQDFLRSGGMPYTFSLETEQEKQNYLNQLLEMTYHADLVERYRIQDKVVLTQLIGILADSIGSQINPKKISDTFRSNGLKKVSEETITRYLVYLEEAFLIQKVRRYDIKGRREIGALAKYYFADPGLALAASHFTRQDSGHLLENIVYNELLYARYQVQVGSLSYRIRSEDSGRTQRAAVEIDFLARRLDRRFFIQVALSVLDPAVLQRERQPLLKCKEAGRKIIVTFDQPIIAVDQDGIEYRSLADFVKELNKM